MNDKIQTCETLLSRCMLRSSVHPDIRLHVLRSRKNAKNIFRNSGTYSFLLWMTVKLFMFLRDTGIQATFHQIKILIGIIAINAFVPSLQSFLPRR